MQKRFKNKKDSDDSEDFVMEDTSFIQPRSNGKRGRPKRKSSSEEAELEVESGDEHEHYDGEESDHPSDEKSSSSSAEKKAKKGKNAAAKVPEEIYVSDPLDL